MTLETFNKQSHCSKLSIFFTEERQKKKERNKLCIRNWKEQFLCFPAHKLAPVVHLFSVKGEGRSERKTRPKQNCKSRGFGPWNGGVHSELREPLHTPSSLSPVSTPPLPGVGVAVVRLVPLQLQNRGGRKRPAFLVSCSLNAEVIASPAPPPSCSRRR